MVSEGAYCLYLQWAAIVFTGFNRDPQIHQSVFSILNCPALRCPTLPHLPHPPHPPHPALPALPYFTFPQNLPQTEALLAGIQQQQQPDHEGRRQHIVRPASIPGQGVGPAQLARRLCGPGPRPAAVPLPLSASRYPRLFLSCCQSLPFCLSCSSLSAFAACAASCDAYPGPPSC